MTQDALIEILRKAVNALPRYSFIKDQDGAVRKVEDTCGAWIDWQSVHAMLDPAAVDALVEASTEPAEE